MIPKIFASMLVLYFSIAELGTTGSWSHTFNIACVFILFYWQGRIDGGSK